MSKNSWLPMLSCLVCGHAGISITLDTYSHVLPGLQEAAAERFDNLLEEKGLDKNRSTDVSKMLARNDDLGLKAVAVPRRWLVFGSPEQKRIQRVNTNKRGSNGGKRNEQQPDK